MSATPAKLYSCDTLLKGLAQDLQDMAAAFGPCIQEEDAVVRPRHLAWHGEVPTADQPHIRDRLRRRAKGAGGDSRPARPGAAGDAVDARGLEGFGDDHRRQDGGEPPRQHRLPRARGAQQQIWNTTPASGSALPRIA
jgi:hypothetical protein